MRVLLSQISAYKTDAWMSTEETLSILVADLAEYIKRSLKIEHNFCTTHLVRNRLRKHFRFWASCCWFFFSVFPQYVLWHVHSLSLMGSLWHGPQLSPDWQFGIKKRLPSCLFQGPWTPLKGSSFHSSLEECNTVGYTCLCSNSDSLSFH